jgi:hypothetical protein
MLADLFGKGARRLSIRKAHFPAGVLWNRRECHTLFVPKAKLGREELGRGLREYLGYEALASEFDVFTLGVTPAEDAELDQVGPFGRKR